MFGSEDALLILNIKWLNPPCNDKLIWTTNGTGKFSVGECYKLNFLDRSLEEVLAVWEKIWKSRLHDRLKIFRWRLMAGVIPTKELLARRLGSRETECVLCGEDIESSLHLFKNCQCIRALAIGSS